jgi:aldehyde dehydrogenase (NAD+)
MKNVEKFYINGEWVTPKSSNTMPVINPANEEEIAKVFLGNAEDVNSAVDAAKNAFDSFSQTSKNERLDLLKKIRS